MAVVGGVLGAGAAGQSSAGPSQPTSQKVSTRGSVTYTTKGTHTPSPPAEAARHLEGCQKGDAAECHAAALDAYYSPRSPTTDRAAFERFKKACDAGYAPSCNGLGTLYAQGRGTAKDEARAAQLYRDACEAGASTACQHLEQALRSGEGVARDPAAADRAKARASCVFEKNLARRSIAACPALR